MNKVAVSRNKNHELIMQCLFIALTYMHMEEEVDVMTIMSSVFKSDFNDIDIFSRKVFTSALSNYDKIVKKIEVHLKDWKWSRIARVAQAILLMSYAHFYYAEKVDKAVVINIAIHLAKKYLDANDYKYINGVLDKVL